MLTIFHIKKRFQNQIEFLETNEKIDIHGTNVDYFDLNGDFLSASNLPLSDGSIKKDLSINNVLIHPSVIMRTKFLKEIHGYNNFFFLCSGL